MYLARFCILIIALSGFCSCVPESRKILTEVDIRIEDPQFRTITEQEYTQETDSLLLYLNHEDPTYRYLAARAFASHQDPAALDSLYRLLNDPVVKVRAMVAHAIGQIGSPESQKALLNGFRQKDTMSVDNGGNNEILFAIGKLGQPRMAELMISAEGYRDSDTLLMEGVLKGIYEFGLRNVNSEAITGYAVEAVRNNRLSDKARLYAAHYLSRTDNLNIEKYKFQISEAFVSEEETRIKMALALALRHTNDKEIEKLLLDQLDLELDYRIKCNIMRALNNYEYITVIEKILSFLEHENPHLSQCAVNYIREKGVKEDAFIYRAYAKRDLPNKVRAELYGALMHVLPYYYSRTKNAVRWHIQQNIDETSDPYILRSYLKGLGSDPESYPYLIEYAKNANPSIDKTAAIASLAELLAREDFIYIYRGYSEFHKRKILEYFKEAILQGDEGIAAHIANAIADERTKLSEMIDGTGFLEEAKAKLQYPDQIEGIYALDKAIASVRGEKEPEMTVDTGYYMPDWSILENQSDEITAIVKTDKGIIEIGLFPKRAPAAVLNFITLSEDKFYDQMAFHRVVPNFVIQTGSPRGDNFGGSSQLLRSNVAEAYYEDEGYVGMASAGLHTESSQWFITHSPTPHLNGRYTIFGKVRSGMTIVHEIQEGDKILDIIITGLQ